MQTATINGQTVRVESGTTILEAARQAGIQIPTLCHVDGLPPVSSCFVCAVQVEGRPTLAPACGMPVADGMNIKTDTDEVRAARRTAIELLLSDHAGDCLAPCRAVCPAGLDIPGFVRHLARGDARRATETIAERLVLPGSLGRICPRLCEGQCRRCHLDEGLAIGALHRYATDRDLGTPHPYLPPKSAPTGKRVAVIGAGPAGLAAAYDLQLRGHACTLFDAHEKAGGMLRYGIPDFRLPQEALDAEITLISRLGAQFRMNTRWGRDIQMPELRQEFDAVFVAIGAQKAQRLGFPGEDLAASALDLLAQVAAGQRPTLGDTVIIVGGGNTAMDAARTAVRLGARDVRVIYRRTRNEMPSLLEEAEAAEHEGVSIEFLVAPARLERPTPARLLVTCQRMQLGEPDESGRRRPVPIPRATFQIEADSVLAAIGQHVDLSPASADGLHFTEWGIKTDPKTSATNLPGVFAGGDAVSGPDLAVRAVAAGRIAAESIHQYLSGRPVVAPPPAVNAVIRGMNEDELAAVFRGIERAPRRPVSQLDLQARRTTFAEVDATLCDADARTESYRCLSCGCAKGDECTLRDLATDYGAEPERFAGERRHFSQDNSHPDVVYEPGKCIMCEACVRIARDAAEPIGLTSLGRGFEVTVGVPFDETLAAALTRVAVRVAESCPTGALSLRRQRACDFCSSRNTTNPFPTGPTSCLPLSPPQRISQ